MKSGYAHKIGTLNLQVGLTSIPLGIYNFISKNELSFKQLCPKCLTPIQYKRVCPKCDKEIDFHDLKSGFQIGKNNIVVIDKEKLKMDTSTKVLAVIDRNSEPEYITSNFYLLLPIEKSEKQYFLLLDILLKKNKELIIEYGLRKKIHLAVLKPYNIAGFDYLTLKGVVYSDSIRQIPKLEKLVEISKEEMDLGLKLFQAIENSIENIKYENIKDKRKEKLLEMIKSGNKKVVSEVKKFSSLQEELAKSLKELKKKKKVKV